MLLFVVLAPIPASGQDTGVGITDPTARAAAVEQELSRLAKQFEEGSVEEARVVAELEVSRREHSALEAEVARLDAALTQNLATLAVAEAAAASAELAAVAARTEVVAAVERVAVATDKVREAALLAYVGQGELELAAVVLQDAETAVELGVGMTYARVVGNVQQARIEQLRREEASLRHLEGAAADAKKKAATTKAELQTVRFRLQTDRANQDAARRARRRRGGRSARAGREGPGRAGRLPGPHRVAAG